MNRSRPDDDGLENRIRHLQSSRLFEGAGRAVVERYAPAFSLHRIPPHTTIVLDPDAERTVHVIRKGRVRLELRTAAGAALVLAQLATGDAFGVETLAQQRPQSKFAVCVQPTLLLSASAGALAEAMTSSRVSSNVARVLAEHLDGAATGLSALANAPLCRSVYAALEYAALERGVAVADGTLLDAALDPDDVAALARTSAHEAATALFFLERSGRIRKNGSSITLLAGY
jgi:CRP-like cAMP-binding protein